MHQEFLWNGYFVHDLVRLVISTLTEFEFVEVEVDILELRRILAAAKRLTHLRVDICRIISDDESSVVSRIDDIPQFKAGLTTLTISTEDKDIPSSSGLGFGETVRTS